MVYLCRMNIRYLAHNEIDFHKWDSCVHFAINSKVYAFSWYLNQVAEEWGGLIEGNYESVFPIVWNDKIPGFLQIYQPQFAQQLGLFSIHSLSEKRMLAFLEAIPEKFKRITINLNSRNKSGVEADFKVEERPNFQLLLNTSYEEIASGFSSNLKRSIKKAAKHELFGGASVSPETLVDLYKTNQGKKIKDLNERSYFTLLRVIYQALHRGKGFITGVKSKDGELCAASFFLVNQGTITNLIPATTDKGREVCAMHFLLDVLIRTHANKPMKLDFEGSGIASIARFYKSFGASNFPYYVIKRNRLPALMRLLIT